MLDSPSEARKNILSIVLSSCTTSRFILVRLVAHVSYALLFASRLFSVFCFCFALSHVSLGSYDSTLLSGLDFHICHRRGVSKFTFFHYVIGIVASPTSAFKTLFAFDLLTALATLFPLGSDKFCSLNGLFCLPAVLVKNGLFCSKFCSDTLILLEFCSVPYLFSQI